MSHFISLQKAIEMTTTYRNNKEAILQPDYQNRNLLPISETFDRSAFDTVLNQAGCEKLRIYYGMDENLLVHAIIVGVNAQDRDMLPASTSGSRSGSEISPASTESDEGDDENIIEAGQRCPPDCPPPPPPAV